MTTQLEYASVTEGPDADGRFLAGFTQPLDISSLTIDIQARGVELGVPIEERIGGAGPTDLGMLWIDGYRVTAPKAKPGETPYVLRAEDDGYGIYLGETRLASARTQQRPAYYDLTTADGIPYEQIALLHLDSLASTVLQTCAYWGNDDQCTFCGIGLSLESGRTIVKKTPEMLAEVAVAARDLDGAVDATLTTGSSKGVDRGARYVAKCAQAVKEASGLPVEIQFEPPLNLDVINEVGDMGVDSVGIHLESFDPAVLARVAPAKARSGMESFFAAWERAVEVFGEGQVSTYVILGMGEDPKITIEGAKRAIDMGVFPMVVPLRPVAGSLMADWPSPPREYTEPIYRQVQGYMALKGLTAGSKAGCARCQACSGLQSMSSQNAHGPHGEAGSPGSNIVPVTIGRGPASLA